ncbi:hypothetical protein [Neobacillus mesonae]|uniref:hypothetical protein n=1 Tax=Neobacillus mesonae TaxID=1193713 RepID=UPI002E1C9886|nr:hypothetical protein [Neobacillus mesonae]
MRLRVMQDILKRHGSNLNLSTENVSGEYEIKQFPDLYMDLRELTKFNFLLAEKQRLEQTTVFHNKNRKVIVDGTTLNEFRNIVNDIQIKVNTVIAAIEEAIPEQDDNSVSIKLPGYVDLTKISTFIKDINTILNQSLVGKYQGTVKLQNFDTGSNWIEVVLSNQDAVVYFGQIVMVATELLRVEFLKWKQTEHTIKALEIDIEAKKVVLEGLKNEFKAKADLHAKMLAEGADIKDGQIEYQTQLSKSIVDLTEYLAVGAEVHTALNAPPEVQQSFPNVEDTQALLENSILLLTSGSEDTGSSGE